MKHNLKILFDKVKKEAVVTDSMGIEISKGPESNTIGVIGKAIARLEKKERSMAMAYSFQKLYGSSSTLYEGNSA